MIALLSLVAAQGATLNLSPMPSGLFDKIHGYMPFALKLSDTKPESVKKTPDAASPRYGAIQIHGQVFAVMFDGKDKVYVDTNADGDLTDDPPADWSMKTVKGRGGESTYRQGTAQIDLTIAGKPCRCSVGMYETPDGIGYYQDFALSGKAEIGGKTYNVVYADPKADWDGKSGILMLDDKGNGQFGPQWFHQVGQPFLLEGKTYEFGLSHGKLSVVPSNKKVVAPVEKDPNEGNGLRAGRPALTFDAKTMDGTAVSFPKSYKGKVVMLDFWATWCGPCMREVPNVVKNYREFHDQGFEVLGVSLDREKSEARIQEVSAQAGIVWPLVYDGKYFKAAIARQYGIQAIPEAYLVDGDTGKIIAAGDDIRGEKLGPAIKKALAAKKR